ncbi:hypothetical protein TNCV_4049291 [Trichonephila clavipes]|nr:hypothetical protein TNCV_4049291 [Trichonephila clavipes]
MSLVRPGDITDLFQSTDWGLGTKESWDDFLVAGVYRSPYEILSPMPPFSIVSGKKLSLQEALDLLQNLRSRISKRSKLSIIIEAK